MGKPWWKRGKVPGVPRLEPIGGRSCRPVCMNGSYVIGLGVPIWLSFVDSMLEMGQKLGKLAVINL